jgi:Zn-dependent protease with chaperone function/Zn-finger nucleic acid-binding protein
MNCPACQHELQQGINRQGKIIDYCESCQGMWLDRGEIFCYAKQPALMATHLSNDLLDASSGERLCPRCTKTMEVGGFVKKELQIDRCRSCGGIWLDSGELQTIKTLSEMGTNARSMNEIESRGFRHQLGGDALTELEAKKQEQPSPAELAAAPALPSLGFRAATTIFFLYGILFFVMVLLTEAAELSPLVSIGFTAVLLFIQFMIGPWLLDLQLSWFYQCVWVNELGLPDHLVAFVKKISQANNMKFPTFGLIADSTPNAFTYGRYPGDARIVITRGLIEKLDPEELESVVAHEIGHAVHWDMALMTVASMVPIILYSIYRILMRLVKSSKGGGKKDPRAPMLAIAVVAYICYVISEYIILFLSRTREYHADTFAANACKNSHSLSSALIKVAYGLASDAAVAGENQQEGEVQASREGTSGRMLAPLGIFDPTAAKALVSSTAILSGGGALNKERVKDAMQWDLWNPWASWYELHSTHPLVAQRLDHLGRMSFRFGHKPFILFDRKQPESYWDEFLVDAFFAYVPLLMALGGLGAGFFLKGHDWAPIGGLLVGLGFGSVLQMSFTYGFEFLPQTVASLLKQVKVSGVRAVSARISGKIIGKGIPGYVLSEDMTFQDETGFLFLDYQQPLSFMEWWFALTKDSYVGQEVIVEGWYKRAPVPYFEIYTIKTGQESVFNKCYTYGARWFLYVALILAGIAMTLA